MRRRHGGTGLHSLSTCGNEATARRRGLFPRCASCGNAGSVQAVALRLKINLEEKGVAKGILSSIKNLMETMGLTIEQAMAALKVPEGERQKYMDLLERQ